MLPLLVFPLIGDQPLCVFIINFAFAVTFNWECALIYFCMVFCVCPSFCVYNLLNADSSSLAGVLGDRSLPDWHNKLPHYWKGSFQLHFGVCWWCSNTAVILQQTAVTAASTGTTSHSPADDLATRGGPFIWVLLYASVQNGCLYLYHSTIWQPWVNPVSTVWQWC